MIVDIKPLFRAAGVHIPQPGIITLASRMEGLEKNPYDDWNYLGLVSWQEIAEERPSLRKVAVIGSGQGVDAIALAHLFNLDVLEVTDIVEKILAPSKANFLQNVPREKMPSLTYFHGRDCHPLTQKMDLITFSPPPLMFPNRRYADTGLDRTTIVPWSDYEHLSSGRDDSLLKWSLLPQLGFLLSSRAKLGRQGRTITLYSGRVPFESIAECYNKADMNLTVRNTIVKRQTDPEYLACYAEYERNFLQGDTFDFFDYEQAQKNLDEVGIALPGLVTELSDKELRNVLESSRINARQALAQSLEGKNVAHIGYALEGKIRF